jgi:putative Holliday junction resolvase
MSNSKKDTGIFLGIDYGTKRLGIATGQLITKTATPLMQIEHDKMLWENIDKLMKEWKPIGIVVGMPFNMDGTASKQMKKVELFLAQLKKKYTALDFYTIDEALTTKAALERIGKNKSKALLNATAAQIILEAFLQEKLPS